MIRRIFSGHKTVAGGLMVLALAILSLPVRAQVTVESSLSRDTILIGDQLDLTLRVVQPAGLQVSLPRFVDTVSQGLEVIGEPRTDTLKRKDGRWEITRTWRVTSFDTSGVVLIDPMAVSWKNDSLTARLETRPLQLVVRLLPVQTDKGPKDIKKPKKLPVTWQEVVVWTGSGLLVLALLVLGILYWKKRKEGKELPAIRKKPSEPAHVFALRELNTLREARLWQQGRVKEYYTRLTDILRTYLEYRYGLRALEQTTPETLQALTESGFNDNRLRGILENILATGDLVKFAKYVPQPDVNESVLLDAFVFVNETKESWKKEEGSEKAGETSPETEVLPQEEDEGKEEVTETPPVTEKDEDRQKMEDAGKEGREDV